MRTAAVVLMFLGAAQATPTPPTLPESFSAKLRMSMPYVSLNEPLSVAVSASKKLQVLVRGARP
jgi:hypothetical protein